VQEGGLVNLEQTQQVMLRNTAQEALRGFGSWWMDLPGQGWFADPAIWTVMKRLRPVDEAMARRERPFAPEIAAILDEDSICHLAGGASAMSRPLIYDARAAMGRSGAPYGQYMLDDVIAGKVDAKLQIFLGTWALTTDQRKALAERRTAGAMRVWCYAPGYILADRADAAAMKEVMGFTARLVSPADMQATPTTAGKALGLTEPWEPKKEKAVVKPLFAVDAQPDETLATYADGSAAVAMRKGERGADVFIGVPQLSPELVRALAKAAGVHLFAATDVALWAADPYISIHAVQDGPLTIDTGREGPVVDALDGSAVGRGPSVTLNMKKGETRVLRY
jgi:beta-galactosidase